MSLSMSSPEEEATFYTPQSHLSGKVSPKISPKSGRSGKVSPKSGRSGKSGKISPKMSPKSGKAGKAKMSPKISPTRASCVPFVKGTGAWRTVDEIREHIICVPDRKRDNQFYNIRNLKQHRKNAYDHFGSDMEVQTCLDRYNADLGTEVTIDEIANCQITNVVNVNPDYAHMLQYLQGLNDTGLVSDTVLDFLQSLVEYTNVSMTALKEILNGAFTIIRGDGGHFYNMFKASADAMACSEWVCGIAETSHDSLDNQYRLGQRSLVGPELLKDREAAPVSHIFDLLVGTSVLPGDLFGSTWFQFEYARLTGESMVRGLWNRVVEHAISFVKYKSTGRNQGVFGGSKYAEYNKPLILDLCIHNGKIRSCVSAELRRKKQHDPFDVTEAYWEQFPSEIFATFVVIKNMVRNVIFQGWRASTYHTFAIKTSLRDVLMNASPATAKKFCAHQAKKREGKVYTIPTFLHDFFEHITKKCL